MQRRSKVIGYDEVYIFSLQLYLFRFLLLSTVNWVERFEGTIYNMGRVLFIINLSLFAVLMILSERTDSVWILAVLLFSTCMLFSYNHSGSTDLFFSTMFALFSYGISAKKLLTVYWKTSLAILCGCIIAYYSGLSRDVVVAFEYGAGHSLGMTHPNALAAFILSLLLTWELVCNEMRFNIRMLVVFALAGGGATWLVTLSRTSVYLIVLFPVLLALVNAATFLKTEKVLALVRTAILFVFIGSFLLMTNSSLQTSIGDFGFRFRFAYPYRIYKAYGIRPFGIDYSSVSMIYRSSIDSSYLHMLLFCGFVPTGIMIALFVWIGRRCYKYGLYSLLVIVSIYVLQGITEQYMIRIAFNCIFLLTLSELDLFGDIEYFPIFVGEHEGE